MKRSLALIITVLAFICIAPAWFVYVWGLDDKYNGEFSTLITILALINGLGIWWLILK